jgi:hypothetical protein
MSRARDNANLGAQAGSGLDASDITSGALGASVTGGAGLGVSTATTTALNAKAPLASPAFTGTPTGITAAHLEAGVLPSDVTGGSGLTELGTVTSGNLSNNNIVMPRFKEYDSFYDPDNTTAYTSGQYAINISHTYYVTITPDATGDILEMGWVFNTYCAIGYIGIGIQRATDTDFTENLTTIWSSGSHGMGFNEDTADSSHYKIAGGVFNVTCSGLTPDTPYHFRMMGMTHSFGGNYGNFGNTVANQTAGEGIRFTIKRWSVA